MAGDPDRSGEDIDNQCNHWFCSVFVDVTSSSMMSVIISADICTYMNEPIVVVPQTCPATDVNPLRNVR